MEEILVEDITAIYLHSISTDDKGTNIASFFHNVKYYEDDGKWTAQALITDIMPDDFQVESFSGTSIINLVVESVAVKMSSKGFYRGINKEKGVALFDLFNEPECALINIGFYDLESILGVDE